jgi:hypothetical protein
MSTSLFPDPLQMWREAVTKLEGDVNSLTTGSMNSQEVVRSLHDFSAASLGMQQLFEKAIGAYLRRANLPSRKDVAELAQALQRIEDKLDRLLPADAVAATAQVPRPARTRKPPAAAATAQPAPAATTARGRAPARRKG